MRLSHRRPRWVNGVGSVWFCCCSQVPLTSVGTRRLRCPGEETQKQEAGSRGGEGPACSRSTNLPTCGVGTPSKLPIPHGQLRRPRCPRPRPRLRVGGRSGTVEGPVSERGPGAPPPPGLKAPVRWLRCVLTAEPRRGVRPDRTPGARPRRAAWGGFLHQVWRAEGLTSGGHPPNTGPPRLHAWGQTPQRPRTPARRGLAHHSLPELPAFASNPLTSAVGMSRTGHHACAYCR